MSESASRSWFEGWQSTIGGRVAEFRRAVQKTVVRAGRGGGAVGAVGLQVERDVQDLANEFGRGLMREAFEIANTTSAEVTVFGETWEFQRIYPGTYETTFGEVSVARSTYQQQGKGRALIPLDLRLRMVEGRYTPLVSRIASRACSWPHDAPVADVHPLDESLGDRWDAGDPALVRLGFLQYDDVDIHGGASWMNFPSRRPLGSEGSERRHEGLARGDAPCQRRSDLSERPRSDRRFH